MAPVEGSSTQKSSIADAYTTDFSEHVQRALYLLSARHQRRKRWRALERGSLPQHVVEVHASGGEPPADG